MGYDHKTGLYRGHQSEPDDAYVASVQASALRPTGAEAPIESPLAKAQAAIEAFAAAVDALDDISKRIDKLAAQAAEAAAVSARSRREVPL